MCGNKSSNGKILFAECHDANPESHLISDETQLDASWLAGKERIGVCGATSTPMWLMHRVKEAAARMLASAGTHAEQGEKEDTKQ